tara:strand:+ start:1058 stop:1681 length:624 start_codon:yes stop_codon:yes gene_type:complete
MMGTPGRCCTEFARDLPEQKRNWNGWQFDVLGRAANCWRPAHLPTKEEWIKNMPKLKKRTPISLERAEVRRALIFLLDDSHPYIMLLGVSQEWMLSALIRPLITGKKAADFGQSGGMGSGFAGLAIDMVIDAARVITRHYHGKEAGRVCVHLRPERLQLAVNRSTCVKQAAEMVGVHRSSFVRACKRQGITVPYLGVRSVLKIKDVT